MLSTMQSVTLLPILAAAIAATIIGYIWFLPHVFGGMWMRLSGITPEAAERSKRRMPLFAVLGLLANMVIAYVMNYFGIAWAISDWAGAVQLGFWCWAGFTAPVLLGSVFWEQRPFRLYMVNALYWLVAMVVMAVVLLFGSMTFNGTQYGQTSSDQNLSGE